MKRKFGTLFVPLTEKTVPVALDVSNAVRDHQWIALENNLRVVEQNGSTHVIISIRALRDLLVLV